MELNLFGLESLLLENFSTAPVVDIDLRKNGIVSIVVDSPDLRLQATAQAANVSKISAYLDE